MVALHCRFGYEVPMRWVEAKITFSSDDDALVTDLVADAFYNLGAKGVVVDDPHLEAHEGWAPDAVVRPQRPAVTGYLPADDSIESRRHYLEQAVAKLASRIPVEYTVEYKSVDEEDWAESWKAFFQAQKITSRMVVKPTWQDYEAAPDEQVIEIDPGMAFGTGTHPTTALCIKLLEKYLKPGDSILDVGTGSGILLIAAAKLGADRLAGIDLDPMAIEVAGRNLKQNNIDPGGVRLMTGDLVENVRASYNVVVANILAEVVIALLEDVAGVLKPGGIFICSGIIEAFKTGVAEKLGLRGFEILDVMQESDWVAFAGRHG